MTCARILRQRDREIDRLGDVVVGPQIERFDHVVALVLRGDHDHRQIGDRPDLSQLPQRLEAAQAGHHHVEQDRVDAAFADHPEGGDAAVGREHLVAAAREPARQRIPVHRVVVDQQQRRVSL